jgi:hypothetical protein
VARVKNRIEALARLEPGVAWLFAVFNAPEEVGKRFVQAPQRALSAAEVDSGKAGVLQTLVLVPSGLIAVGARDLPLVPEPLPLGQCLLVQAPVSFEQLPLLAGVCPQTKLVGFELHLGISSALRYNAHQQ